MKKIVLSIATAIMLFSCATQKELSYLSNLSETGGEEYFTMDFPDYKVQARDILYVSVKAQTAEGTLNEMLIDRSFANAGFVQGESSQYITGYSIDPEGHVTIPLLGKIPVGGMTIYQIRDLFQGKVDSLFRHAYVEVRLVSFKFTVLGEVRLPGSYLNYNDQLTVLEAIGRAGGITETGEKKKILVIRPVGNTTQTYNLNLLDKNLLASPAYFLSPNDVVIVQPSAKKVFNLNLPTFSFIITSVTSTITATLLLINFFK